MVGMADPSSSTSSDPEAGASSPVDKPTSPPRGISVHNVALEAEAASKRLSNHSNTTDDTDDEQVHDDSRGPELQMRQKRQRSRARALNAAAALAAAGELAIHLPDVDRDLINTWDTVAGDDLEEIREHVLLMFGSLGLLRVDCETPTQQRGL